jgi:hypothetical protein
MNDAEKATGDAASYRERVVAVAVALRELHRTLVDATRERYEASHGRIESPAELLRLLMHEPEFGWLRELSGLMVDVDELLDLGEITGRDAVAVRAEVERLIASPSEDTPFGAHYREALQADSNVVVAHGRTRAAVANLPEAGDAESEWTTAHRRGWSERRLAERRK